MAISNDCAAVQANTSGTQAISGPAAGTDWIITSASISHTGDTPTVPTITVLRNGTDSIVYTSDELQPGETVQFPELSGVVLKGDNTDSLEVAIDANQTGTVNFDFSFVAKS